MDDKMAWCGDGCCFCTHCYVCKHVPSVKVAEDALNEELKKYIKPEDDIELIPVKLKCKYFV